MKRVMIFMMLPAMFIITFFLTNCDDEDNNDVQEVIGWAAGNKLHGFGTILHTKNGGVTWERQGDTSMIPEADLQDIRAVDKEVVWAVGAPEDDGTPVILKTVDGGKTWIRQGTGLGLQDVSFSGICPVNRNVCWAAGYNGTILKTADGGENWTVIYPDPIFLCSYQMIAAVDENRAWVVGEGDTVAMIHYTSDGGLTWERQGTDSLTTGNMPNALIDIHAANADYVWAVGPSQAIYTLDGGKTWVNKRTPIGFIHNNGVCIINDQLVWVATDDNLIFKLSGLDGEWEPQTDIEGAISAMYLGVTAMDENQVWITSEAYSGLGQIFHTADGGSTWVIQDIPEEISLRRITFAGGKR